MQLGDSPFGAPLQALRHQAPTIAPFPLPKGGLREEAVSSSFYLSFVLEDLCED